MSDAPTAGGNGPILVPGMVPTGPAIVTSRFDVADGYTIDGYLRTGGYTRAAQGARRHGARPGAQRGEGGRAARPGRRRLPGRREVGLLPARGVPPLRGHQRRRERARHVQGPHAHGARSPPAHRGHRAHLLRGRRGAGLPLRAGRDGAGPGAPRPGAQRRLRRGLRRQEHPRHRLQRRHHAHLGRRRLHRGRGDGAHREPRGQPGHAPAEAAVLPGGQGPLPAADDRQQRRDAVEHPVDRRQRRRGLQGDRPADVHGHADVRGVRPREPPRRVRGAAGRHHVPPPLRGARVRRWHPQRPPAQGVHPRWSVGDVVLRGAPRPARSTSPPSTRPARCSAPAPSW